MAGILFVFKASYYNKEVKVLSIIKIFLCRESVSQFGQQKKRTTVDNVVLWILSPSFFTSFWLFQ